MLQIPPPPLWAWLLVSTLAICLLAFSARGEITAVGKPADDGDAAGTGGPAGGIAGAPSLDRPTSGGGAPYRVCSCWFHNPFNDCVVWDCKEVWPDADH